MKTLKHLAKASHNEITRLINIKRLHGHSALGHVKLTLMTL